MAEHRRQMQEEINTLHKRMDRIEGITWGLRRRQEELVAPYMLVVEREHGGIRGWRWLRGVQAGGSHPTGQGNGDPFILHEAGVGADFRRG